MLALRSLSSRISLFREDEKEGGAVWPAEVGSAE